jgi:CRISPR/Cas system-associated protein endoribonuclease Cas2
MRDLRDETCTNVSIQLSLLMKRLKRGEVKKIMLTRKQYAQVEGINKRFHLSMEKEESGNDLLITISHHDT